MIKSGTYVAQILVALIACNAAMADHFTTVPGWFLSGSAATKYVIATDNFVAYEGTSSASLSAAADADGNEFGTLMQQMDARPYLGKRMRFSAYLRTSGVASTAALWMRVDGADGQILEFDNMSNRGRIKGEQPWVQWDVVLDIPQEARRIAYGVFLAGEGMVWIDNVSLQPVSEQIATTGLDVVVSYMPVPRDNLPRLPVNLNFEQRGQGGKK